MSAAAFESLATLQRLTLEAGLSDSRRQLVFRILNRSILYCRYDRAALWGLSTRRPKLLGVSGSSDPNAQAPLVVEWRRVIAALPDRTRATLVEPATLADEQQTWQRLAQRTRGLSVAWLPITAAGRTLAGLWLERWAGAAFTPADLVRLEALALAYGVAWRAAARPPSRLLAAIGSRRRLVAIAGLLVLAMVLAFVRVPLRIVAPCEVVPDDPLAITAPLAGVIDQVLVLPGRTVAAGDLLAVYDKRVALEELKVAQQQVHIIESDLQRARVQAFDDPAARAEIALLENRLAQEQTRLRIAEQRAERLEIRAPLDGTVMMDDPHAWRGRPTQVGERLMLLVDPRRSKLRIWLPAHDNIAFDPDTPATVILDSDPRTRRTATLRYVANFSQVDRTGRPGFRAEADWQTAEPDLKLGLQGSAVLYGPRVSLGYWLIRRPLAAVRQYLGV